MKQPSRQSKDENENMEIDKDDQGNEEGESEMEDLDIMNKDSVREKNTTIKVSPNINGRNNWPCRDRDHLRLISFGPFLFIV